MFWVYSYLYSLLRLSGELATTLTLFYPLFILHLIHRPRFGLDFHPLKFHKAREVSAPL